MKAVAVIPAKKQLAIIDRPMPAIASPTQLKLRVLEVGVCGTDHEIAKFEYGTPPSGCEELVIGHESLGEVVETGPKVEGFKAGDLAMVMVRRPCQHRDCGPCRAGRQDFCQTGDYSERGIKLLDGFMSEYVVDEQDYMFKVPHEIRDFGVLTEPLTIADKACAQLTTVQQRLPWACQHQGNDPGSCHTCLVLGSGPVGLLGALVFRAEGFNVIVYSRGGAGEDRARILNTIGAKYVSTNDVPANQIRDEASSFDVVFEATGASQLSFDVIPQLGVNGVFIFTGVPGRKSRDFSIDGNRIMQQMVLSNQVIFGTVNAGRESYLNSIRRLSDFEKRWPGVARSLITARHPVDDFRNLLTTDPGGIKHAISFDATKTEC